MDMSKWAGIPEGMVLIKKGGRPKSDDRNVAIYLMRLWRTEILGEPVKKADAWILNHYQLLNGITEESTIRRAIRAAKDGPLLDYYFLRLPSSYKLSTGEVDFAVAVSFLCLKDGTERGTTVWSWHEGMKTAESYILDFPRVKFVMVDTFDSDRT